jgi:predicted nuclease with TOPRIM domain
MSEPTYSVKEIIELQFRNLSKEMTEIKSLLEKQNTQVDKQFQRLDVEIKEIRDRVDQLTTDNTRYKMIIGIGATAGASVITFFLNRIF